MRYYCSDSFIIIVIIRTSIFPLVLVFHEFSKRGEGGTSQNLISENIGEYLLSHAARNILKERESK